MQRSLCHRHDSHWGLHDMQAFPLDRLSCVQIFLHHRHGSYWGPHNMQASPHHRYGFHWGPLYVQTSSYHRCSSYWGLSHTELSSATSNSRVTIAIYGIFCHIFNPIIGLGSQAQSSHPGSPTISYQHFQLLSVCI